MEPYKVHLDDWTVALYSCDDGRLTFTISNSQNDGDYLTRVVGNVRLRRYYLGNMCSGELKASPFITSSKDKPMSKEAILAKQGAG